MATDLKLNADRPPPEDSSVALLDLRKGVADMSCTTKQPVTIVVGTAEAIQTFYIYEDILTRHSEFFAAALRGPWKESDERIFRLPEVETEVFGTFASFIHNAKICTVRDDYEAEKKQDPEWTRLSACWLLGDKLMSPNFQDAALDAIVAKTLATGHYPTSMQKAAYKRSTGSNGLKRLAVDIAVFEWANSQLEGTKPMDVLSESFLDLAIRYRDLSEAERKDTAPYHGSRCARYHQHGDTKPCYRTTKFH